LSLALALRREDLPAKVAGIAYDRRSRAGKEHTMAGLDGLNKLTQISKLKAAVDKGKKIKGDDMVVALLFSIDQRLKELNTRLERTPKNPR
jgi:hypothetical protein